MPQRGEGGLLERGLSRAFTVYTWVERDNVEKSYNMIYNADTKPQTTSCVIDLAIVRLKVLHDDHYITMPPIICGTQTILLICLTYPSLLEILFLFALKVAFQPYLFKS